MQSLYTYLSQFVTPRRLELINKIVQNRTRYITVVVEDIFQPHNASAVLRSCDCFGVQDVHIIENQNQYEVNPDVALGASKWLQMLRYNSMENNTLQAISALKQKGYRIVATTPHIDSTLLGDFDLAKGKTALLFGTELNGLSQIAINNSDEYIKIPMYGFTESFNISVSAAIILQHLIEKLRKSGIPWQLDEKSQNHLKTEWLKNSIKNADLLIKKFNNSATNI